MKNHYDRMVARRYAELNNEKYWTWAIKFTFILLGVVLIKNLILWIM